MTYETCGPVQWPSFLTGWGAGPPPSGSVTGLNNFNFYHYAMGHESQLLLALLFQRLNCKTIELNQTTA